MFEAYEKDVFELEEERGYVDPEETEMLMRRASRRYKGRKFDPYANSDRQRKNK